MPSFAVSSITSSCRRRRTLYHSCSKPGTASLRTQCQWCYSNVIYIKLERSVTGRIVCNLPSSRQRERHSQTRHYHREMVRYTSRHLRRCSVTTACQHVLTSSALTPSWIICDIRSLQLDQRNSHNTSSTTCCHCCVPTPLKDVRTGQTITVSLSTMSWSNTPSWSHSKSQSWPECFAIWWPCNVWVDAPVH